MPHKDDSTYLARRVRHPKYCSNLDAWLAVNKSHPDDRIVVSKPNQLGMRLIGQLDDCGWLYGARLISVIQHGVNESACSFPDTEPSLRAGIDENFWQRYEANGRCAIDPEHLMWANDVQRWKHLSRHIRRCQWCGLVQIKLEWSDSKDTHLSEWVPA